MFRLVFSWMCKKYHIPRALKGQCFTLIVLRWVGIIFFPVWLPIGMISVMLRFNFKPEHFSNLANIFIAFIIEVMSLFINVISSDIIANLNISSFITIPLIFGSFRILFARYPLLVERVALK